MGSSRPLSSVSDTPNLARVSAAWLPPLPTPSTDFSRRTMVVVKALASTPPSCRMLLSFPASSVVMCMRWLSLYTFSPASAAYMAASTIPLIAAVTTPTAPPIRAIAPTLMPAMLVKLSPTLAIAPFRPPPPLMASTTPVNILDRPPCCFPAVVCSWFLISAIVRCSRTFLLYHLRILGVSQGDYLLLQTHLLRQRAFLDAQLIRQGSCRAQVLGVNIHLDADPVLLRLQPGDIRLDRLIGINKVPVKLRKIKPQA